MKQVDRPGDMHPTRFLRLIEQSGGDIIISIYQDGMVIGNLDELASVEFCTSGGRSPKTLQALRLLAEAMREDEQNRPV